MNRIRFSALVICIALICCICSIPAHADESAPPNLISESAVLIDADTGQVLYSKEMDKQQYPASITKIITVALALENAQLTDTITMSDNAVNSVGRNTSHIALTGGEMITVEHAVYAAMLMSANDACNGLAEHVSGSIEGFAALMTQKAAEWGAKNTNFNNANGLKDDKHYTSAYDMAMIMRHALTIDKFREIIGTKTYQMPPNNKQNETRYFANQHSMLIDPKFAYEGIIGGKAGYTTAAQFTLVTAAERNGITLIAVVMKSPRNDDKYHDTAALLDYGFNNFSRHELSVDSLAQENVTVSDTFGNERSFNLSMEEPVKFLLHNSISEEEIVKKISSTGGFDSSFDITLNLSLESSVYMHPEIGSYDYIHTGDSAKASAKADVPEQVKVSVLATVFKVLGIIVLIPIVGFLLLVLVIYIRKQIYYYKRRRRRRQQYERRYK